MTIEARGVPAVALVLPDFEKQARREGGVHGLPDLRLVVLPPNELGDTLAGPEHLERLTERILPELVRQLLEVR